MLLARAVGESTDPARPAPEHVPLGRFAAVRRRGRITRARLRAAAARRPSPPRRRRARRRRGRPVRRAPEIVGVDALRAAENWEATTIFMNVILGFDE